MSKVKATNKGDYEHCSSPGDFFLTPPNEHEGGARRLSFICTCGCGTLAGIRVRDDGRQQDGTWSWDLDEASPTCSPSIDIKGEDAHSSHWHGYLTKGEFVSC